MLGRPEFAHEKSYNLEIWKAAGEGKFEWAMPSLKLDTEDKDSRRNRSKMARMKFIPFDIESKMYS